MLTATAAVEARAGVDRRVKDEASLLRCALGEVRDRDSSPCLGWDGKEPGRTLRPWLRAQLFWQQTTSAPPAKWGLKLYAALPEGSLPRLLADTLPEDRVMGEQGYSEIMKLLLNEFRFYLEVELAKAADAFLFAGARDPSELFVTYVSRRKISLTELKACSTRSSTPSSPGTS